MAKDGEVATVVQMASEKDEPALPSMAKYKRGQNVDYKVVNVYLENAKGNRKSKTRNFEETCKNCKTSSASWRTTQLDLKCYYLKIEVTWNLKEWRKHTKSIKNDYGKKSILPLLRRCPFRLVILIS
jgi:hypothetical protein